MVLAAPGGNNEYFWDETQTILFLYRQSVMMTAGKVPINNVAKKKEQGAANVESKNCSEHKY